MFSVTITHDYGVVDGDARHFIRSGEMAVPVFAEYGFVDDLAEIGKLLVLNHSFFGDLFLGETSPDYLLSLLDTINSKDLFLGLELLLNALDINASAGGFLSESKMIDLLSVNTIEKLQEFAGNWTESRFYYLLSGKSVSNEFLKSLPDDSAAYYFQYFHNIALHLSEEELSKVFEMSCLLVKARDEKEVEPFNFIAFSNDGIYSEIETEASRCACYCNRIDDSGYYFWNPFCYYSRWIY